MKGHSITLIVFRERDELSWISAVPSDFHIVIYNRGGFLQDIDLLRRATVIPLPEGEGGKAGSYLSHLLAHGDSGTEWTIFASDNPLDHSPEFVGLLPQQTLWSQIQPLSFHPFPGTPGIPSEVPVRDRRNQLGINPIRKETFSLYSLNTSRYLDSESSHVLERYSRIYGIGRETNLASHFLDQAGLTEQAAHASKCDLGSYARGSLFAVHRSRISAVPRRTLEKLHALLLENEDLYNQLLERFWLHLFGEQFIKLLPSSSVGVRRPLEAT
jgi:hypothetical protein